MPSYEIFGKFYDAVMGDGSESAKRVSELVRVSKPDVTKVLGMRGQVGDAGTGDAGTGDAGTGHLSTHLTRPCRQAAEKPANVRQADYSSMWQQRQDTCVAADP